MPSTPPSRVSQTHLGALLVTIALVAVILPLSLRAGSARAGGDPQPGAVSVPGDFNHLIGCSADWQPNCAQAQMSLRPDDIWWATFTLPGGSYQYKVALNNSWTENYGAHAVANGANIPLTVAAGGQNVTFYYDNATHWITDDVNSQIVTAVGDFQTALGCPANNDPNCFRSWLEDPDGDGIYTFSTTAIPAGHYQVQAALNRSSSVVYGAGGVLNGSPLSFTVPATGDTTYISYNASTHAVSAFAAPLVQPPPAAFGHPTAPRGDVIANLFEWNWPSVASECTNVLGPAGYGGVQVAPPQDSISDNAGHPWWEVYQPVDYNLASRMGNEAQFKAMVATCRAVGVKVYVDAVINHMTAGSPDGNPTGTSYGGVIYSKYLYPGLYTPADFHHFPADCPEPDSTIHDWNSYTEVTKCELLGLADLRTESTSVEGTLDAYLNKLISYGVSGFRIDAAKHIGEPDLAAIEADLHNTADGQRPYLALEVMPGGSGQLAPAAFEGEGSLLGFDYAYAVTGAFKSSITGLKVLSSSGLLPSDKELDFVENHDTSFNGSTLNYKDGPVNTLATEFMLAYGYGTPQVFASFTWATSNDSPPAGAAGYVTNTSCSNGWACVDRSIGPANMVDWHDYVAGAPVANWYDDGKNLIAFSRGARGWIAINNEPAAQTHTFTTGLPAGIYCDIIHGTYSVRAAGVQGTCTGPTVRVAPNGRATVTVPPLDAVAFDAGDLVHGP